MFDIALINGKVFIEGAFKKTNVYIKDQKISYIGEDYLPSVKTIELPHMEIIPGIIDPHVHFELDLGWIKSVDDFYHGSVAALYGGVTTIIDFLDPVDHPDALEEAFLKRVKLAKKCQVNYKFHATIKNPKCDLEAFVLKMKSLGMNTLKLFTTYSDSNRRTYDKDIIELLKLSKKHNILVLAHIENDAKIDLNPSYTHQDLLKSRPSIAETEEAIKLAKYAQRTKGNLYMVHLSSGVTLYRLVNEFRDILGKNFFIESCPQYFTFTSDKLLEKFGHYYTCAPPLRSQHEMQLLKDYMHHIDTIGTDHCTFLKVDKKKDFLKDIPLGIGSIEHSFNIMRTNFGEQIIPKMTQNVAQIHQIKNKGEIKVGYDADLFIYQMEPNTIKDQHGKSDFNPYFGKNVLGKVIATMVNGEFRMINQTLVEGEGKWIKWKENI